MRIYDFIDAQKGYRINRDVIALNDVYKSILAAFKKANLGEYGTYNDGDGITLSVPAGKVRFVLQYVKSSVLAEPQTYGRLVFVLNDKITGEDVPIAALQFNTDWTVYTSDSREKVFDSGFGGVALLDAGVNHIALGLNAAIVSYYTDRLKA
ncbi:MAG: hypothetical protein EKK45_20830 [Curvibacter sp.]|nr:MAG: hypothetical protein EKK45_20830 [Curvibacter sp.]